MISESKPFISLLRHGVWTNRDHEQLITVFLKLARLLLSSNLADQAAGMP